MSFEVFVDTDPRRSKRHSDALKREIGQLLTELKEGPPHSVALTDISVATIRKYARQIGVKVSTTGIGSSAYKDMADKYRTLVRIRPDKL